MGKSIIFASCKTFIALCDMIIDEWITLQTPKYSKSGSLKWFYINLEATSHSYTYIFVLL